MLTNMKFIFLLTLLLLCACKPNDYSSNNATSNIIDICMDNNGHTYVLVSSNLNGSSEGTISYILEYDSRNVLEREFLLEEYINIVNFQPLYLNFIANKLFIGGLSADSHENYIVSLADNFNIDCIWRGGSVNISGITHSRGDPPIALGGVIRESNGKENATLIGIEPDCTKSYQRIWDFQDGCNIMGVAGSNHNIAVCGYYLGDFECIDDVYSKGSSDIFIMMMDESGECGWINSFGGPSTDNAQGINVDPQGNVIVTGYFTDYIEVTTIEGEITAPSKGRTDIFTAKLSPDGDIIWIRTLGSTANDLAWFIQADQQSNIYIVGRVGDNCDFTPEDGISQIYHQRSFVAKYNSIGDLTNIYGWREADVPTAIECSNNGSIYISSPFRFDDKNIIVREHIMTDNVLSDVYDAVLIELLFVCE